MNPTQIGHKAEKAASVYLEMRGFKIIERNWSRTKYEIDIIALKDDVIHFVEVKHRINDNQGGGLEAITASKLKHMQRAAQGWVSETKWPGEYVLSAVETSGSSYAVISFIENVF